MGRQFLKNAVRALSISETDKAEVLDDGALFRAFPSNEQNRTTPTRDLVPDNMVGSGSPHQKKSKVIAWNAINVPFAGALNTTTSVKALRAFMGGTATETADMTHATSDWEILMKLPGNVPFLLNYLENLTVGRLFAEVFFASWQATQEMKGEPTFSAQMGNPGRFLDLADTGIDVADIEALATYLKFDPNKTVLTWSDGVGSYNYAGEHRLISTSVNLTQVVNVEGLPGDPYLDAANECKGSFAGSLDIGEQKGEMTAKVYDDGDFDDFNAFANNRTITNLKLIFKTCEFIGTGSVNHFEIEIKFPQADMNYVEDAQNGKSAYNLTFNAIVGDPAKNNSLAIVRIRQVGDANIDE